MRRKGHVISVHSLRRPTPTYYYNQSRKNAQFCQSALIHACNSGPACAIMRFMGAGTLRRKLYLYGVNLGHLHPDYLANRLAYDPGGIRGYPVQPHDLIQHALPAAQLRGVADPGSRRGGRAAVGFPLARRRVGVGQPVVHRAPVTKGPAGRGALIGQTKGEAQRPLPCASMMPNTSAG